MLLVLPAVAVILIFHIVPALTLFYLGSTDYSGLGTPRWVGIQNYLNLIHSQDFIEAFRNTFFFVIGYVVPDLIIGLALALLLNQRLKGLGFFRTVYFIPVVLSTTTMSVMALWVFDRQFGLVNYFLSLMKLPHQAWLLNPRLAMPVIIVVSIWQFVGYKVVIFLAGLQGIPQELYEAAAIDGAGSWAKFRSITLPLLAPITFFAFVTDCIYASQVFTQILVLTGGGPGRNGTTTLVLQIYREAFISFRLGTASATAVMLFLAVLILTAVNFRGFSPREIN